MNLIDQIRHDFFVFLEKKTNIEHADLQKRCTFQIQVEASKQAFGDIATNAALVLAKTQKTNPRTFAQTIVDEFSHTYLAQKSIAGPGFINFTLTRDAWNDIIQNLQQEGSQFFTLDPTVPKKNINVEFVSANPTGPLHFGHGRNGIIGDTLARVLSFLGHNVTREFYINDAGAQITKLGKSLYIRVQQALGHNVDLPEDAYHGTYLQDVAQAFIAKYGDQALTTGSDCYESFAKEKMLQQLKNTLEKYAIRFDEWFSEKSLHESGSVQETLQKLRSKNVLYTEDGAQWFASTQFGDDKDRVMVRSDGSVTYAAADAAYLQNKLDRNYDQLIMVLGHDHHSFATRLKGIMEALGYNPDKLDIILYQLVHVIKDGKAARMSKRAANIVSLEDIIDTVGTDVARFFYLYRKADAELEFDVNLALQHSNENPVYYIQYAYVRTCSMLRKAEEEYNLKPQGHINLDEQDLGLCKKLVHLKYLLQSIEQNHQIHLLAYYTHDIASEFHTYYNQHPIINPDDPKTTQQKLTLVQCVQKTLKTCLDILGLSAPEKM